MGHGKSFIALDWAASVATARNWQNRPTERLRVLYIAAEGAFGLQARVTAWETGWKQALGDDDLSILPCAVNLTDPHEVAELVGLVALGGYGLVVIDTLARCMVGADENSAKDCGQVVDALTRLREATPGDLGVVLAVHHTGKDGKTFRGSSVFEGGADTVYLVTEDGGVIALDREKRKDGPKDDEHTLRLAPMAESCVVNAYREPPGGGADMAGNSER
jgi:predicted ATP-dependent serine protease